MLSPISWLRRHNVIALVDPHVLTLNDSSDPSMRGHLKPEQIDYEGWRGLDFSACAHGLKSLSYVPSGIKVLKFSGCRDLEYAPSLPDGIKEVDFSGCSRLRLLPKEIPNSIKRLNLSYCPNLQITTEQKRRLAELEEQGCDIQYPSQFIAFSEAEEALKKLATIAQRYKELNDLEALNPIASTTRLLERFLTENIGQRGGRKEIIEAVNPVLEVLEKHPHVLKSVEEIAALHLDGCVNQPVAGWSEISALASIANAETVTEKLEAAKHLFVNDQISNFVAREFGRAAVEAEAGNALFREVHKKALKHQDIKKPWLGVPGPIAYEAAVARWLAPNFFTRRGMVDKFYNQIKEPILHRDEAELADLLCEGNHCKTWGEIVFPEQVAEINQRHEQEREKRWLEIDKIPEGTPEKAGIIEGFNQYKTASEITQDQEIRREVKTLMVAALNPQQGISTESIKVDVPQNQNVGITVRGGWPLSRGRDISRI